MKYCNQQKNEKPLNAQRDRDREKEREKEREREGGKLQAATTVGCWLLPAGWLVAGWLCWLGWQHPLAKISFCVKSLKWASAWLGLEQCRESKGELRVESWCCAVWDLWVLQVPGKNCCCKAKPEKDLEKVEAAGQERSSSGTSRAALAAEVGKTRWVRVETRTRTKFVADVVKNWQQMLLNFKRNFTYLSCGAHSLRCSFERSFRQPTSCCSTLPPLRTPLAAAATLSKLATGHAWRLHQGDFFASPPQLCISSPAFSLHWPYLIIHQNFVGWRGVNLWARPLTLICGRIAASLLLCLCPSLSPAEHSFPAADFHLTCSFRFRFNDALIGLAVCAWRSTPLTVSPLSSLLPFFPSPLPSLSHTLALTNELCFKR